MVYVIQEQSNKNILPATKFGKIEYLLPPNKTIMFSVGPATMELKKKLFNFNDNDYLLLIGDPTAIGIATAVAADSNKGRVKLLKWDRQERVYFVINFNLYPQRGESLSE